MNAVEARLECLRIAAEQVGGKSPADLLALAAGLIALVEGGPETIEISGADSLAGERGRRSVPRDPARRAAPPAAAEVGQGRPTETDSPGIMKPAKDPEGVAPTGDDPAPAVASARATTAGVRDLPRSLMEVFAALEASPHALSAPALADRLGASRTAVSQRLYQLKKRGLVIAQGRARLATWCLVAAEKEPEPEPDPEPDTDTEPEPDTTRSESDPAAADSEAPPPARARDQKDWNLPAPLNEALPEQRKMRFCLGPGCGKYFSSDGPGNRICPACTPTVRNRAGGLDDAMGVTS